MHLKNTLPLLALVAILAWPASPLRAAEPTQNVLAVINGVEVSRQDFQAFIRLRLSKQKNPGRLNKQQLQGLLNEFINRELLYQEAVSKHIDALPEVVTEIENQRRNIVSSHLIQELVSKPPSEEEMKKIYKEQLSQPHKEYHARHILVKNEQRAKDIIAELGKGADFAKLAQENSIDSSAQRGGDLGWFSLNRMARPFAVAVSRMKTGAITPAPVQTRFGWHVIKLEDTREAPPPPYEAVKPRIAQMIQQQRINTYVNSLRNEARIELK